MPQLAGQVVIITGASAGIGEETARRLVRGGAKVVITARRPERLEALARELDSTGANVLAIAGDITSDADRRKLVAAALEKFGRIDGLVNNAGYGTRGPVEIVPVDLIRKNFETNIFSLIALAQIKNDPNSQEGRGLAIAGLVLSLLSMALAVLFFGFGLALNSSDILRKIQHL